MRQHDIKFARLESLHHSRHHRFADPSEIQIFKLQINVDGTLAALMNVDCIDS